MSGSDSDLNPYSPPRIANSLPSEYSFDGTVNLKDFTALLPPLLGFLSRLAVLVSGLGLCCTLPGIVFGLLTLDYQTCVAAGTGSLLLGVMFFLCAFVLTPHRRARRAIARYPDLLGPARGNVSKNGLVLDDGIHVHWFGSICIKTAVVNRNGIRLPISPDPYRFVALPRRIFLYFNMKGIRKLAAEAAHDESGVPIDWEQMENSVARNLGNRPSSASVFRSSQTVSNPFLKQFRTRMLMNIAGMVLFVGLITFWWPNQPNYFIWAVAILALSLLYDVFQLLRVLRKTSHVELRNLGWVYENRIMLAQNQFAVMSPLSEFTVLDESESRIQLLSRAGAITNIERDFLIDKDQWAVIVATIQRYARKNEVLSNKSV